MKDKKNRTLKVYGQSGYHYKDTPTIVLKGQWLSATGFDIGDKMQVEVENGRLLLQNITKRKETAE